MSHETPCFLLPPPSTIPVSAGDRVVEIDPYEANDALPDKLREFLAEKLDVPAERFGLNQLLQFRDMVVAVIERLEEERKKKQDALPQLLDCILGSRLDGNNGRMKSSTDSWTNTPTSNLGLYPEPSPSEEMTPPAVTTEH